jgi:hypothetical protein
MQAEAFRGLSKCMVAARFDYRPSLAGVPMPTLADLERWCSTDRLAAYVTEAAGVSDLAVRLYHWNAELSGAFMEVTHHVEVILRNRMHGALEVSFPAAPDPWYMQGVLRGAKGPTLIEEAERRIGQRGNVVTPNRVIASLPFGFWNALFGHQYEDLWRSSLNVCFKPYGPSMTIC